MASAESVLKTLHPLERKILPFLREGATLKELVKLSGMKEVEAMRALQWLENKEVLNITQSTVEAIALDKNGEKYINEGLPEIRFLKQVGKDTPISKIDISKEELNISIGILRKRIAITIKKGKELMFSITGQGKKMLEKGTLEEQLLKSLPLKVESLSPEQVFAYRELKLRKGIIKTDIVKTRSIGLTELGKKLCLMKFDAKDIIDTLTQGILKEKSWKGKSFRAYDIRINVPKVFGGRKQHYRNFLEEVRVKLLAMGFTEMRGPIVETDFWDMDALFMPQFHSARDIHDAYYVKDPKYGKVDAKLIQKVKAAHENGFNTGSKGWQYKFDEKRTLRNLLRTQTTACSARMLASKGLKVPGKYFAIARCFRYDVVDATHNCDFFQTEGIVVEEGLNFGHLKALLKMFAEEFAQTDQIKIKPAYFPFTEPSAELFAKHPEMGWIELAGSGIFRPEMTKPLGVNVPVVAWGIGIDRIAMFKLGIKDIRQLFSHDLGFLRGVKYV
ncbi:MAG: phenylalanine--tRNA ligase subunit alpha [Candidatus Woesearchaeota archaeon]